jgi:outer membrane protein assembly factor BamD (BamD/ComL family)
MIKHSNTYYSYSLSHFDQSKKQALRDYFNRSYPNADKGDWQRFRRALIRTWGADEPHATPEAAMQAFLNVPDEIRCFMDEPCECCDVSLF